MGTGASNRSFPARRRALGAGGRVLLVSLGVAIAVATGCGKKRYAEVDLEEGYLETPWNERVPIGESFNKADRTFRPGWRRQTRVEGEGRDAFVQLQLDSQRARVERTLSVSLYGQNEPEARIVESEAYFQIGRGPKQPLVVLPPQSRVVVDESGSEVRSHHLLGFELPPPLSTYALYMPGANLIEETYVAIYWDGRNTYTLHIPFTVGDARWVHHMEFEIEAKRRLVIGAPGMP